MGEAPWKRNYALRCGVEGTIHQATAITGLRRASYRRLSKTHSITSTAP
ncbi:hypothetical protein ACH4VM_40355 [Streptomyces sp. NPDC020792]